MRAIRAALAPPSATRPDARPTSRASQRKFASAIAPPAPTPAAVGAPASHHAAAVSAATRSPPVLVTRAARSVMPTPVLVRPGFLIQCLDGPVKVHARRRDAEPEPDKQEPWARAEQPIREVAGRQSDRHAREQHRPEIDEMCGLTPRRPIFGRSHVTRNTITGPQG